MGIIKSGSDKVLTEGKKTARVGDAVQVKASEIAAASKSKLKIPTPPKNVTGGAIIPESSGGVGGSYAPELNYEGDLNEGVPGSVLVSLDSTEDAEKSTLQDYVNMVSSAGILDGGELSSIGTTVSILEGNALIRIADDSISALKFATFDANSVTIPDDGQTHYIGFEYVDGSLELLVRTTDNFNLNTELPLGSASVIDGILYVLSNPHRVSDATKSIIQRLNAKEHASRDESIGGLILASGPARTLLLSAGRIWTKLNYRDITAKDSATDEVTAVYYDGSSLIYDTRTDWANDKYWNANALVTLPGASFACIWVYVFAETGKLFYAYGTDDYTAVADASIEQPPSYLTSDFKKSTLLVGRLIFLAGASTPEVVDSAFSVVFPSKGGGGGGGATYILKAGDTGIGTLEFNNNQTLIRAAGNARLSTGALGGTFTISAGTANNIAFVVANSTGGTVANFGMPGTLNSEFFGNTTFSNNISVSGQTNTSGRIRPNFNVPAIDGDAYQTGHIEMMTSNGSLPRIGFHRVGIDAVSLYYSGGDTLKLRNNISGDYTMWHSGNDGAGTGLDSDLLDGQHGSFYAANTSLANYVLKAGDTVTGVLTSRSTSHALSIRRPVTSNTAADFDIGQNPTGVAGDNGGYIYLRAAGDLWFGTDNVIRGKILSTGVLEWYHGITATSALLSSDLTNNTASQISWRTSTDSRLLVRNNSGFTYIDAVNNINSAFTGMGFRAANFSFEAPMVITSSLKVHQDFVKLTADGAWSLVMNNAADTHTAGGLWRDSNTSIRFTNAAFNASISLNSSGLITLLGTTSFSSLALFSQAGTGTEAIRISNVTDTKRLHSFANTTMAGVRSENSDLQLNAADGGFFVRLRTQGTDRLIIEPTRSVFTNRIDVSGDGNPTGATAAVTAAGAYGGGFRMVDGAVHTGMWTQSDSTMRFGLGNSGGLTQRFMLRPEGAELLGTLVSIRNNAAINLSSWGEMQLRAESNNGTSLPGIGFHRSGAGVAAALYYAGNDGNGAQFRARSSNDIDSLFWHSTNDGAGSGLDADLLDGLQGSAFSRTASPSTHGGTLMSRDHRGSTDAPSFWGSKGLYQDFKTAAEAGMATGSFASVSTHVLWDDDSGGGIHQMIYSDTGNLWRRYGTRAGGWGAMRVVWDSGNDGAGSGLDADLLDGVQGNQFVQGTTANRTTAYPGDNLNNEAPSGFFELTPGGTNGPTAATWYWMMNTRHSNVGNHYAFQMAQVIGGNQTYVRNINAGTPGAWDRLAFWNADVTFRDVIASRGDGTGVIFFTGSRYLYYNGTLYDLPGSPLTVGGYINDNRGDVRDMPRVTVGLTAGCMYATAAGFTINTGLAAGRTYGVYNDSGAAITLTQGSGLTLRKSGTATTGNLTLAARGFAFIWCNSTTEYIVSGDI